MNPGAAVLSRTGAAQLADFSNATGAPIVGDTDTGMLYWMTHGLPFPISNVWNAKGFGIDTASDQSTVAQAAIDTLSADGGGIIQFNWWENYTLNVVLKDGVILLGNPYLSPDMASVLTVNMPKLTAATSGAVIDTSAAITNLCGVIGLGIQGLGSGTACKGVHFRNVSRSIIANVNANNLSDEGILLDSSCIACTVAGSLAINCVLDRVRAVKIGAVDIHGTDHYLDSIEATVSGSIEGKVQSANMYCVAFMIRATNCKKIIGLTGEISDIGIEVTGSNNPFIECSAELNYGHGWNVTGGGNRFALCQGLNNSQDTTNTYDNFLASAASANNRYFLCSAGDSVTKKAKNGFEDLVSSASNKNVYVDCSSTTAVTAQFVSQTNNGSAFSFSSGTVKALTIDSTTPSVVGYERWATGNTVPTTITDFTEGVQGQCIIVNCGDSNTTIQHNGATISLPNNINKKLISGQNYMFWKSGSLWRILNTDAYIQASATYDPPNIAAAGTTTTTVATTGAVLGDFADCSFSLDLQGIVATAYVSAADVVTVALFNPTAGGIDLASGTLRVRVRKI